MECVFVSILLKSQSSYWVSWKKRRGANTQACPPGLWQQRDLLYGLMDCLSSYSPGTSGSEVLTAVCVLPLFGLSIGGNRTKMSARRIHLICLTSDETKWSSTARCNQKMQLSLKLIVAMVIPSIHLSNCLPALKCQQCHIANIKALSNWLSSLSTLSCWCRLGYTVIQCYVMVTLLWHRPC